MMPKILTTAQVASILGVVPSTISRWRVHGKGPKCFQVDSKWFYTEETLQEWIEENISANKEK